MSKIIRVINVMISNSDKISQVIVGQDSDQTEYFFLYDKKHKWSTSQDADGIYYLHFYPGPESLEQLSSLSEDAWQVYDKYVTYTSKELKAREAYESMQELYQLIKEKSFGIDDAFDDIIEDGAPF